MARTVGSGLKKKMEKVVVVKSDETELMTNGGGDHLTEETAEASAVDVIEAIEEQES